MASIVLERFIAASEERRYFTIPFLVPQGVETMTVSYAYPRHAQRQEGAFTLDTEECIIDLGLNMPGGEFAGASGSDRTEITVSPFGSSHGYASVDIRPGQWELIVGAYKVPPQGVTVSYKIDLAEKRMRLFKGDLHTHTTGSDGVLTPEELAELCARQGLDFVFVTNHNSWFENEHLPRRGDLTVIPGAEWTHYKGHANLLGRVKPYGNPFCVNTEEEARSILLEGKKSGAMLVFNHPFCAPECGWRWGMDIAPMDAVEIWNGAMMIGSNEEALCWWNAQLCQGRHLPAVGGSDFHREGPMSLPGMPTTCVYALSRAPEDILLALRKGNCFLSMTPDGPEVDMTCAQAGMGDTVSHASPVQLRFSHLKGGDLLRIITDRTQEDTLCPLGTLTAQLAFAQTGVRFVRCEVLRCLVPGAAPQRVMVSNPMYFNPEE